VVPRFAISPSRIEELRDALEQLLRDNPGVRPEKLVSAHIERQRRRRARQRRFLELAQDPQIVELVSDVIGDDVSCGAATCFCKPAHEGYETPWHQDGHYWRSGRWPLYGVGGARALHARQRLPARDPTLASQSRLHAHLFEDRTDLTLNQRMADGTFDETQAVDIELQPAMFAARRVHDPRCQTQHSARRRTVWRCATYRRPRVRA